MTPWQPISTCPVAGLFGRHPSESGLVLLNMSFVDPDPKADMTGLASVYEVFKRQTDLLFATPIP
jgi:hypothetical protein